MSAKRIVVAIDFSQFSEIVVEKAISLAKGFKAVIDLLHVEEDVYHLKKSHFLTPMDNEFVSTIERFHSIRLAQCSKELNNLYKKVPKVYRGKSIILEGHPTEVIFDYITKNKVEILVIGSKGSSNLSMHLLGSTADKLSRKAPCCIFIVKG